MRGFNNIYWDNYTGSANYDIYVIDAKGGTPRRVTDTEDNERWPNFSADGQTIWFVAEDKGVANFYSLLENAAGAVVTLTVNDKPKSEGSHEEKVRPIARETNLRYLDWVQSRRAMVDECRGTG